MTTGVGAGVTTGVGAGVTTGVGAGVTTGVGAGVTTGVGVGEGLDVSWQNVTWLVPCWFGPWVRSVSPNDSADAAVGA